MKNKFFIFPKFFNTLLFFALIILFNQSVFAQNHNSAEHEKKEFDLSGILHHELIDSVIWELNIGGKKIYEGDPDFTKTPFIRSYIFKDKDNRLYMYKGGIPMHLTRRVVQLFIVSALLVLILILIARRIASNPYKIRGRFSNMIESLFVWCKQDLADPSMHGHAKGFYSFVLTIFFFILALNLAGLFPQIGLAVDKTHQLVTTNALASEHKAVGETDSPWVAFWPGLTVTGDLSFTIVLSLITVIMIWITGFRYQGIRYLWDVVPKGVPLPLYIILWPLEFIIGPISKGFALMIRLLANMTAGHVVILSFLGFIFQASKLWYAGVGSALGATGITFTALAGVVAIYFLEILVSFLQAFIFTLLTSLFIGSAMHRH